MNCTIRFDTMRNHRRCTTSAFAAPVYFSAAASRGTTAFVGTSSVRCNNLYKRRRARTDNFHDYDYDYSPFHFSVRCAVLPTVDDPIPPIPPMPPVLSGLNGTGPLYAALLCAQLIPFVFPHSGLVGDVSYFSITAVSALVLGCRRAQLEEGYGSDDAQILTGKTALAAPFVASGMLFGLFALLKYTHIDVALVINALTCLSAAFCLKESLDPVSEAFLEKIGVQEATVKTAANSIRSMAKNKNKRDQDQAGDDNKNVENVDDDDDVKVVFKPSDWVSAAISAGVTGGYLATHSFVLSNFLSLGIVCRILSLVKLESFAAASALLLGLVLYDVYWVFGSERVFSENVMVAVATLETPGKLLFPRSVIDGVVSEQFKYAILGLGDLFVPGLFVTVLGSISNITGGPYFKVGIAAYTAGLLTCFVANTISAAPQPALLYIVPALLAAAVGTAAVRGELQEVVAYKVDAATVGGNSNSNSNSSTADKSNATNEKEE